MKSTRTLSLVIAAVSGVLAIGFAAPLAHAAAMYSYAAGAAAYTGVGGQTINVPVFLVETNTPPGTSFLTQQQGLAGAGLAISRTIGTASLAGLSTNPAFGGISQSSFTAAAGSFTESVALTSSTGVGADAGTTRTFLGSLQITATAVPTTFRLSAFVNSNGSTGANTLTFDDFYDLDTTSVSPAFTAATPGLFTVSPPVAVPEPASLTVLGVGSIVLTRRRRTI